MKFIKYLLVFLLLFSKSNALSQIVNIPDANFKTKLLSASATNTVAKNLVGTFFKIDLNNDGEIQEIEAQQVSYLNVSCSSCGNSQKISNLSGIEFFTGLIELDCSSNLLDNLSITNQSIQKFNCSYNLILNILQINLPNLLEFNCSHNVISSFNFANTPNLKKLNCSNNDLSGNLNLNTVILLEDLNCSSAFLLPILFVSSNVNLKTINISDNNTETVDVANCKNLILFNANNSLLRSFEFPVFNNPNGLRDFGFSNCNQLNFISTKNGQINSYSMDVSDCQNLKYICKDENEGLNIVDNGTLTFNFQVGTYCSFVPGGNYNTINGKAAFDNENDGCDSNDDSFEFLRLNLSNGTNSSSTFTNNAGNYSFFTNAGNFTVTPQFENPSYFSVAPATIPVNFTNSLNNTSTNNNFCITPNGINNDLEIVLTQTTPARPGLAAEYRLVYKNKGNQTVSGTVSMTFDDAKLDFINSNVLPSTISTGILTWNYNNLKPFENRNIVINLNVNSVTQSPAVNNGDVLVFNATITPLASDAIAADNVFTYNQTVVASFDPNDIYCLEGSSISASQIGEYLHYTVRFENTGTATAENIVVATTVNPNDFDLSTLQLLNASNDVYTRIKDNLVEFIFKHIQLASSPAGGHGHVLMKIKSKSTLQPNAIVSKNAKIFFGYNAPVNTNDVNTAFTALKNQLFEQDTSITVFPNPTNAVINISSINSIKRIELYDAQGRLLQTEFEKQWSASIDISEKLNGIYFIKVKTDKGSFVEKIVVKK